MRKLQVLIAALVFAACEPIHDEAPAPAAVKRQALVTAFAAGSLIIPMDTTSQDNGTLTAFGLLHRVLQANIPVHRIALTGKAAGATDFSATVNQRETGLPLGTVAYRGGPFVIDSADAAAALPIVDAYLAADAVTNVHVATAAFSADVQRTLVAAPRIGVFEDGYEAIAYSYLNAANIRDSLGNAWTAASPGSITIAQVRGATNGGAFDGVLFNADGTPAFDQLTSMHYDGPANNEAVREVRGWLSLGPITHAYMQCEAIPTFENNVNGHFLTTLGVQDDGATANPDNVRVPDSLFAQFDGNFTVDTGLTDSLGLAAGSVLRANSSVLIDRAGSPFLTRMVWLTGFVDGNAGLGKISYLVGHNYTTALPISGNAGTNGVRFFLDSLYETPGLFNTLQPVLAVTKSAPAQTSAATFTFTLNYSNTGTAPAFNASLTDVLPAGTTFVSATGGGVNAAGTVTWTLGNLAASAAGSVTVTVSAPEGTYANQATLAYRVGVTNKTLLSNTTSTLVDRTAPLAPVVIAPANGSLINSATPTYSGTAEANSTVKVSVDGVLVCTVTASGAGAFSCAQPVTLSQGSHTVNATATDATNNVSPVSNTNTFTVDSSAPLAPVVNTPADGSATNNPTPTYSGTAEANSTVTVRVDGVSVCVVVASGAGAFSCVQPVALSQASHTVNATSTDAANNVSPVSNTNTFTVDTTAPVAPVVTTPGNGSFVNTATPTYSGTAEANSTVKVTVDGVLVCTVIANGAGAFSCVQPVALTQGAHSVNATATDAANNVSPVSGTNTFTVDTVAPAAPVMIAPANGSASNNTLPTYSGTAEPGASVTVQVDGATVCVVTATAGGTFSCAQPAALGNGPHTVNATARDAANNASGVSNTNTFTVDTVAPVAPVVTAPANGAQAGATPTYSGTAEPGSTVTVQVDGATVCTAVATAGGAFSCVQPVALADGSHSVNATATDAANNVSPVSNTNTFTVDSVAPAAPVVVAPANGGTASATPTYSGTAEAGSTVTVQVDGATVCTAVATAGGTFSCVQSVALGSGSHTVNATARDAANNVSPVSNTNTFSVDTTPPAAPVVQAPANGATAGATPTYSGTAEPGSTVTVTVDGATACTAVTSAGGNFSCVQPTALSAGTHTVNATATDAANNVSPVSNTNTFTVDNVPPAAPVVSSPANGSFSSPTPTYSGTAEAGATVTVQVDGVTACTAIATAGGTFSCVQPTALSQGAHTVNATATDAANNASPVSNTNAFTVDTVSPAAPVVTAPANGGSSGSTPTYTGTAEPGATVTVQVDGATVCVATATAGGTFSCVQPTALADGSHTVNATASDAAGNTSPASTTNTFTVDTTAPDTSIVSGPPAQSASSSATFDFGSTEAGVTYECSLDGAAFTACGDPVTFTALADGSHTLQVRARDAAGNVDPTPASQTWNVSTGLDTTIVSGPPALSNSASAAFDFSSNTANVTYECSLDGAAFVACADPSTFTALPDGAHTLRVRAKDSGGNFDTTPALAAWTIDTTPPTAPLINSPTNNSTVASTTPVIRGSGEPGTTVTVVIDGVAVGTAVVDAGGSWSFTPTTPLGNGPHTVSATAKDPAGNTGPSSTPISFTVDPTVLDTTIVTGPSSLTNSKSAAFDFASNKSPVTYECSLDGAAFAPCADPATFANLADGPHSLLVRAKDGAGAVDPSPAAWVWTVDAIAPVAPVVTSPANNATVGTSTPTIRGTAEAGSTVTVVIDGVVVGTAPVDATGNWSFVPSTPLSAGPHTVLARATDPAGNVGPDSPTNAFTVNTAILDTFIVSGPNPVSRFDSAAFDLDSNQSNVTYECSLDGGAFAPCSDPATFTGLSDGSHTIQVRAKDAGGAVDTTPASFTWVVDTKAPTAPVITSPANNAMLSDNRPVISGTAEPGATVAVTLDGKFLGVATADSMGKWSLPVTAPLADGTHTVSAVATDAAGNASPPSATNTFTVTTGTGTYAAPVIDSPASGGVSGDNTPTISGRGPPNSTISVFVDGVLVGTTTTDATGHWTFTPTTPLSDGPHTLTAKANDATQTSALSTPVMITIDTRPPETTIVTSPPAENFADHAQFTFGSDESPVSYECSLDGGAFSPCTQTLNLNMLRFGAHHLEVRAVDTAGNVDATPAVFDWVQSQTPPVRHDERLAGGGCGCNAADPGTLLGGLAVLSLLVARRRRASDAGT